MNGASNFSLSCDTSTNGARLAVTVVWIYQSTGEKGYISSDIVLSGVISSSGGLPLPEASTSRVQPSEAGISSDVCLLEVVVLYRQVKAILFDSYLLWGLPCFPNCC